MSNYSDKTTGVCLAIETRSDGSAALRVCEKESGEHRTPRRLALKSDLKKQDLMCAIADYLKQNPNTPVRFQPNLFSKTSTGMSSQEMLGSAGAIKLSAPSNACALRIAGYLEQTAKKQKAPAAPAGKNSKIR